MTCEWTDKQRFHRRVPILKMRPVIQLTPVYRKQFDDCERRRLKVTLQHNKLWAHAFFGPESMDYTRIMLDFPNSAVYKFPDQFFNSRSEYSKLMLEVDFYKTFSEYRSILITQLDSVVVKEIPEYLLESFDYVGSAWARPFWIFSLNQRLILVSRRIFHPICKQVWVGNGGLSLRNVDAVIEVLTKFQSGRKVTALFELNRDLNEDVVISYLMQKYDKRTPSLHETESLFIEAGAKHMKDSGSALGFHALEVYNPSLEERILSSAFLE